MNLNPTFGFTGKELRKLKSLRTPAGIQRFLEDLEYHLADTAWSPRRVLRERTAHCFEGAVFAAAGLRVLGFPPLLMDLSAHHDTDHVLAIFKVGNGWGALAKSNYAGCRYREPVYRTLRELAMSYFEDYFNLRRERTLRVYSGPVNLKRFDRLAWMTSEKEIWFIAEYLVDVHHYRLLTPEMERGLVRVDKRTLESGLVGRRVPPG